MFGPDGEESIATTRVLSRWVYLYGAGDRHVGDIEFSGGRG